MSIIQEKIYLTKNASGATISFGLDSGINISGYQQEIDGITEKTKNDLINPIEDYEITRFKYSTGSGNQLYFYFLNSGNTSYNSTYNNAGFSDYDISGKTDVFRNSFFILDFFDSYSSNTQTRLFTNYQTKLGSTPRFQLNSNQSHQICYSNIPNWFIETQSQTTITLYLKLSFYNAKEGKLQLFYNQSINNVNNPQNLYFTVNFYPETKTWKFTKNENAYEVNPNNAYVERNNETFTSFENKKQNYPSGNVFEDDGTYDTVD